MAYYETQRQYVDISKVAFVGRVLDVGGGGEGIISQHSGNKVIAIDKRADELAETPDIGTKVIMDACQLKFLDGYFDTITCFYTLMYMDVAQIERFLNEAYRVLKAGGTLWVWDAEIPAHATADVFVAQLEVKVSENQTITTGYGVSWNREQSLETIRNLCEQAGFHSENSNKDAESFFLSLRKI
ncbi:MAG: class I SAM-dependent methyltransferase [Defluviitaleaceae bacterium]|nr:class I SAM-dependent methyltransferase [Defluviitaleaceae bacterium]MCL2239980.1 class I SAM-dependent methyltransferase [Defluviitaleaceae bacterium]